MRYFLTFIFDAAVAIVAAVVGWAMFDNTPPQVRLHAYITSAKNSDRSPRLGESFVVHWTSTPNTRTCPGEVQIEIIQGNVIWPVMKRAAMEPPTGADKFQPAPWPVPEWAKPGPAVYRVTTFWRCNWFQKMFPGWAIRQVGPDVPFTILPRKLKGADSVPTDKSNP